MPVYAILAGFGIVFIQTFPNSKKIYSSNIQKLIACEIEVLVWSLAFWRSHKKTEFHFTSWTRDFKTEPAIAETSKRRLKEEGLLILAYGVND